MKGARRDIYQSTQRLHTHIVFIIDICIEVGSEITSNLEVPILTSIVQGSLAILHQDITDEGYEEGQRFTHTAIHTHIIFCIDICF